MEGSTSYQWLGLGDWGHRGWLVMVETCLVWSLWVFWATRGCRGKKCQAWIGSLQASHLSYRGEDLRGGEEGREWFKRITRPNVYHWATTSRSGLVQERDAAISRNQITCWTFEGPDSTKCLNCGALFLKSSNFLSSMTCMMHLHLKSVELLVTKANSIT